MAFKANRQDKKNIKLIKQKFNLDTDVGAIRFALQVTAELYKEKKV